jgi:hypothetical protein
MRHITIEEPIFTIPKKSGALGINSPSVVSCEIDILKRVGAEFWASRRENSSLCVRRFSVYRSADLSTIARSFHGEV